MKELLFVHIPKTGGGSVGYVLDKVCPYKLLKHTREKDLVTLAEYKKKHDCFSFAFVRNPYDRVVSAYFYLLKGGGNKGDDDDRKKYFSNYTEENFDKFIVKVLSEKKILKQIHFMPQYEWISDSNKVVVDFIGKLENFADDMTKMLKKLDINVKVHSSPLFGVSKYTYYPIEYFNRFLQKINSKHRLLPITNLSKHKNYRDYYNSKTKKIVKEVYKKDFELFEYVF